MPLPSPNTGENKDDFTSRCMGNAVMLEEYPEEKQRAAVCNNQWSRTAIKYMEDGMPQAARKGVIEMAEQPEKWFPILKTGTHKDSIGRLWTFGEAELDKLVESYDPAKFEAPIVVGHPKEADPAFGWVGGLKREGEMLLAQPKQLDEGFRKLVNEGRFKKISAKMTPDLQQLLHVGFFGAHPVSVKDLPTVSLSDQDKDGIEIEFSDEWQQRTIADTFRRIREWIIEKFDTEQADKVVPSWVVEELIPTPSVPEAATEPAFREEKITKDKAPSLSSENIKDGVPQSGRGGAHMSIKDAIKARFSKAVDDIPEADLVTNPVMFSEAEVKAQVEKATKEATDKAKAEGKKEGEAEFAEQKKELKRTELDQYVDGLIAGDGKKGRPLAAAKKAGLVEFMLRLDGEEAIEFAEGKEKVPMLAQMKALLETLPADITFSEVATKEKDVEPDDKAAQRKKEVAEFAEKHPDMAYREVILEVSKEKPELFKQEE